MPTATCDKHSKEELKVYCMECKTAVCVICYIKQHSAHKCSDVDEVCEELRKQIGEDGDKVDSGIKSCDGVLSDLHKQKNVFIEEARRAEEEICAAAEQMKQLIERQKQKMVDELKAKENEKAKEVESVKEEIEFHRTALQSFRRYSAELRDKGTACDVTRAASGLRERAKELLAVDVADQLKKISLEAIKICFKPTDLLTTDSSEKLLGSIRFEG